MTNSFLIEATGTDGVGASFKRSGVVTNSGRIEAAATGGIAIQAADTVTVNNLSSGVITGDRRAIEAATANVNNDNLIEATAASGAIAIQASDTVTVNNSTSGVIRASGVLGTAITADTVNVTANAGTISGGTTGINAFTVNVTSNAGTISGGEFGIFADTVNVTSNTGTISGGLIGIRAGNADITNFNLITGARRVSSPILSRWRIRAPSRRQARTGLASLPTMLPP